MEHLSAEERACLIFLEETIESLEVEEDSGLSTDEPEERLPVPVSFATTLDHLSSPVGQSRTDGTLGGALLTPASPSRPSTQGKHWGNCTGYLLLYQVIFLTWKKCETLCSWLLSNFEMLVLQMCQCILTMIPWWSRSRTTSPAS